MSKITVVTPAASTDLVSLADVKSYLGITNTDSDDILGTFISAASASVDSYLGYPLASQTVKEELLGNGRCYLYTYYPFVTSITHVKIDGTALDADEYDLVQGDSGKIAYLGKTWPCAANCNTPNIEIQYTAGFALPSSLPADLQLGVMSSVAQAFRAKDRDPSLRSEEVPNVYKHTFASVSDQQANSRGGISAELEAVLAKYRAYRV